MPTRNTTFYRTLAPTETSPLLEESTQSHQSSLVQKRIAFQVASAAQELLVTRMCFLIDAVGMILVSFSRDSTGIMISTVIGSMGAPAAPSLQALVTLAASPSELGRVLAGFSILECTGVALRNPILLGLYTATLEVAPRTIWYFTAGLFVFCAFCLMCLQPTRFIRKPDDETSSN
ncbi:hypothetical protein QCA50_006475 [Cerrena zonata]|uniref:Uncharacterized protein n=1 Tax=Cerrena zonata TaxID=2478898 RepID=A0AAW0GK00_9APHY